MDEKRALATITLPEADTTGYLLVAAEVDGHSGPPSETKRALFADLGASASALRREMFANLLIMTAERLRPGTGGPPRFDVAVLVQAPTIESAHWLKGDPAFARLYKRVHEAARQTHVVVTYNVRKNACEYGPRLPRAYMLMRYLAGDDREVVPGWGWTYRRHLLTDLLFSPAVHRYRRATPTTRSILYRLA